MQFDGLASHPTTVIGLLCAGSLGVQGPPRLDQRPRKTWLVFQVQDGTYPATDQPAGIWDGMRFLPIPTC